MTAALRRPAWPLAAFAAVVSTVYLVAALVVVPALAVTPRPEILAAALVADLVVLVPLAYVVLVVRRRGWPAGTVGAAVALSGLGAWLVLPAAHRGLVAVAVPIVEGVLVAAVVVALVRAVRRGGAGDAYDRLGAATARVLGDGRASRALASELAVFRYALGPLAASEAGAFTYRQSSGYGAVVAGVGIVAVVELVGGHLLVQHLWGPTAALVHLALSGYAVLWLVADWRALGARPHRLGKGVLHARCGLRWSIDVPLDAIEAIYRVCGPLPSDAPVLDASVLKNADLLLALRRSVVAHGPYGLRREVSRVALGVDEPDRLLAEVETAMAP